MRRKLAESYYHSPVILCPLCEHLESIKDISRNNPEDSLDKSMKRMIEHLINKHTDEEAKSLGWMYEDI